jgi:hypothetical protein
MTVICRHFFAIFLTKHSLLRSLANWQTYTNMTLQHVTTCWNLHLLDPITLPFEFWWSCEEFLRQVLPFPLQQSTHVVSNRTFQNWRETSYILSEMRSKTLTITTRGIIVTMKTCDNQKQTMAAWKILKVQDGLRWIWPFVWLFWALAAYAAWLQWLVSEVSADGTAKLHLFD